MWRFLYTGRTRRTLGLCWTCRWSWLSWLVLKIKSVLKDQNILDKSIFWAVLPSFLWSSWWIYVHLDLSDLCHLCHLPDSLCQSSIYSQCFAWIFCRDCVTARKEILYTLNLQSFICQSYVNKTKEKKPHSPDGLSWLVKLPIKSWTTQAHLLWCPMAYPYRVVFKFQPPAIFADLPCQIGRESSLCYDTLGLILDINYIPDCFLLSLCHSLGLSSILAAVGCWTADTLSYIQALETTFFTKDI